MARFFLYKQFLATFPFMEFYAVLNLTSLRLEKEYCKIILCYKGFCKGLIASIGSNKSNTWSANKDGNQELVENSFVLWFLMLRIFVNFLFCALSPSATVPPFKEQPWLEEKYSSGLQLLFFPVMTRIWNFCVIFFPGPPPTNFFNEKVFEDKFLRNYKTIKKLINRR